MVVGRSVTLEEVRMLTQGLHGIASIGSQCKPENEALQVLVCYARPSASNALTMGLLLCQPGAGVAKDCVFTPPPPFTLSSVSYRSSKVVVASPLHSVLLLLAKIQDCGQLP